MDKDLQTEISGQPQLRRLISAAVSQQGMAHAYLLSGPDSSGLLRVALSVACALKCRDREGVPCGNCIECRRVAQNNHPDVHVVLPDGETLKLGQVRDLQSTLHMKSTEGGDKVGILAQAERMSLEAANSLLKTLEDPPPETILILTTRQAGKLPPTVLSRCQIVRLAPVAPQVIANRLIACDVEEAAADLVARLCHGDEELARHWLDQEDMVKLHDEIAGELASLEEVDPLALAEAWEKRGKDKDTLLLKMEIGLLILRDALVATAQGHLPPSGENHALGKVLGLEGLSDSIRIVLRMQDYIRSNVNARLALDAMFLALRGVRRYAGSSRNSL